MHVTTVSPNVMPQPMLMQRYAYTVATYSFVGSTCFERCSPVHFLIQYVANIFQQYAKWTLFDVHLAYINLWVFYQNVY